MSTEWDTRAEAWQARKHSTTIRRSRKGGDNSRVNRRGLPPVIGSDVTSARWDDLVPADVSDALRAEIRGSHRLLLGKSGLDLARLVDRFADVLDIEPMLGGEAIAYAQTFDVANASPGADVFDVIGLTNARDSLTGWADSPGAAQAFRDPSNHESKLSWPARMTAGTARSRKSESEHAGPRVPGSDGKLHRTGRLYGAEFVRTGRRAHLVTSAQASPVWPRVTWYRRGMIGRQLSAPCLYGSIAGWHKLTPWVESRSFGVRTITDHAGRKVSTTRLTWQDDPNYDQRTRVFIGHRSIVRGKARQVDVKQAHHLGAFVLTNTEQVTHLFSLLAPGTVCTVRYPSEVFGTFSRADSGRYSLSMTTPTGNVRHQPRGMAAAIEYASRYLTT